MKYVFIGVLAFGFSASAVSSADTVGADAIVFQSLQQTSDGSVRTLEGNVRIETRDVIIRADKATFDADTLDIQPAGHVHITLKRQ